MEQVKYTVRPGNTLFGIAQFFDTSVQEILMYNNIKDPSQIFIGQELTIPAGSIPNNYYVVRPGDSLWSIAQRNNMSVSNLAMMNPLNNPNVIYPGQILMIR